MRHIFFVALFSLICLPAWAEEQIVLSRRDDPLAKASEKIAIEAFRRIGYKAEFRVLPSERALQDADDGQTAGDIVRMAGIEKLYPGLVQVPEPMVSYDTVAFTTGLNFKVDGWESLRPYRLCILRGMKMAEINTEGMNRVASKDVPQSILMLKGGRCDVAVLGYTAWPEIDKMHAGPLRSLEPPVTSVPLFLYLNKKYGGLAPKLNDALQQMKAGGTTARILSEMESEIQAARSRNTQH